MLILMSILRQDLVKNKFGIPIEMLDSIFSQIQRSPHVQLVGFHFHIGSQILNLETFHVLASESTNYKTICRSAIFK